MKSSIWEAAGPWFSGFKLKRPLFPRPFRECLCIVLSTDPSESSPRAARPSNTRRKPCAATANDERKQALLLSLRSEQTYPIRAYKRPPPISISSQRCSSRPCHASSSSRSSRGCGSQRALRISPGSPPESPPTPPQLRPSPPSTFTT